MLTLDKKRVDTIIRFALKEDIWTGDVTSRAVLERFRDVDAVLLSRSKGVVCGIDIIERVFAAVEYSLRFKPMVSDGARIEEGQEIAFVEGETHTIMKAERTAINFLSMLSGIATRTRELADLTEGTSAAIFDTRKTIPLHRYLEKYAVRVGGGKNHREGLWDMVLIKDNHIRAYMMQTGIKETAEAVRRMVKKAKSGVQKNIKIEIEVESLAEFKSVLEEKPDIIMLDNMTPEEVSEAVRIREEKGLRKVVLLEASGGIKEEKIKDYASTGVDRISVGALTSDIRPLDFSLEVILK
jgi:nicotinate-nucleotide pyrophosphorylase (carboxylating)